LVYDLYPQDKDQIATFYFYSFDKFTIYRDFKKLQKSIEKDQIKLSN